MIAPASGSRTDGPGRFPRPAALGLAAAALVLDLAALLLLVPQPGDAVGRLDGNTIGGYVLGATYPIVGWIIASRRPQNWIGWIFLGIGLSQALDTFAGQYATVGIATNPGSLPAADLLSWVAVWAWTPGFTLLLTVSVLLFPDGRLPTPRWRPVVGLAGLAQVLLALPVAIVAWPSRGAGLLGTGPVQSADPVASALLAIQFVGLILLAVGGLASMAGLIVRFRRSRGTERIQLKWFVAAGIVEIAALLGSVFLSPPDGPVNAIVTLVVAPLLPVAAAIAILRYRLYDIDRIVSRTVAWGTVTLILVLVFSGAVVALDDLLAGVTQGQTLAVAASTLAAFSLFQPLRWRVQRLVDRRFDRARYNAERIVDTFAEGLRGQVDLTQINHGMLTTVSSAIRPRAEAVWLRDPPRSRDRGHDPSQRQA